MTQKSIQKLMYFKSWSKCFNLFSFFSCLPPP